MTAESIPMEVLVPEQLTLDVATEKTDTQSTEQLDLAVSVLKAHDGDAVAAIRELLADADFLRDQLYIASSLMSKGIGRGLKPKYERL